jgi:hypothetical protein
MFIAKDWQEYNESHDITVSASAEKGTALQLRDVFGFWLKEVVLGAVETFVYKMANVLADKTTGTGEEILALERVYYVVATGLITAHPTGTFGTDFYYCGIAREDATADEDTVLINFDGTRWNENV